jgi:hypothetical protein
MSAKPDTMRVAVLPDDCRRGIALQRRADIVIGCGA